MKAFYKDIELEVFEHLYDPKEDSFLLADSLENLKGKKLLDVGCGTGLISITAAKIGAEVTAIDINEKAVNCTIFNAKKNKVNIKVLQSDLFKNILGKFDIITFNPPYVPGKIGDITIDGGKQGREIIDRFIKQAKDYLTSNGYILLLVSSSNKFKLGKTIKKEHIFFEDLLVKKIERGDLH